MSPRLNLYWLTLALATLTLQLVTETAQGRLTTLRSDQVLQNKVSPPPPPPPQVLGIKDRAARHEDRQCLTGCQCQWREEKRRSGGHAQPQQKQRHLVALSCGDDDGSSSCSPEEASGLPWDFWSSLETLSIVGGASYNCTAATAFYYSRDVLRSLSVSASDGDGEKRPFFRVEDVAYLRNLQSLSLTNVQLDEESNLALHLAGMRRLEHLDLSANNFRTFNFVHLFLWPALETFSLYGSAGLASVTFQATDDLAIPFNDTFQSLRDIDLSFNPNLVSVCPWAVKSSSSAVLARLDLSHNPSLAVYPSSFQSSNNRQLTVNLANSSFFCDCHISLEASSSNNVSADNWLKDILDMPCLSPSLAAKAAGQSRLKISSLKDFLRSGACDSPAAEQVSQPLPLISDNEDEMATEKLAASVNTKVVLDCAGSNPPPTSSAPEYVAWITPIHGIRVRADTPSPTDTLLARAPAANATDDMVGGWCEARNDVFEARCVPQDKQLILSRVVYFSGGEDHVRVLANGSLLIDGFGWRDRGLYVCYGWSKDTEDQVSLAFNSTHSVKLDVGYRQRLYNLSLVYGFATASGFLLITLLAKLIYFVLHNYGCCLFCCCCKNQLPPKARRLKNALDSIEAYRSQQQDKLRENYHQQTDWIRQNCAQQMERVRDNYNSQIQNLKDIRQYGSVQLHGVRDQYYEQMHRIRDYSANQLERVHENYIFQRQKLRKFSAQNYLKMRETSKHTRRTVNKVMETLPSLYLDLTACRQGLSERQGSLEWEKDADFNSLPVTELAAPPAPGGGRNNSASLANGVANYPGLSHSKSCNFGDVRDAVMTSSQYQQPHQRFSISERRSESVYFTPTGTPLREIGVPAAGAAGGAPYIKAVKDPYKAVYHQHDNRDVTVEGDVTCQQGANVTAAAAAGKIPPWIKNRGKSKGFSFSLPSYWFNAQQQEQQPPTTCQKQQLHQAVIEHVPSSDDYLDIRGEVAVAEATNTTVEKEEEVRKEEEEEGSEEERLLPPQQQQQPPEAAAAAAAAATAALIGKQLSNNSQSSCAGSISDDMTSSASKSSDVTRSVWLAGSGGTGGGGGSSIKSGSGGATQEQLAPDANDVIVTSRVSTLFKNTDDVEKLPPKAEPESFDDDDDEEEVDEEQVEHHTAAAVNSNYCKSADNLQVRHIDDDVTTTSSNSDDVTNSPRPSHNKRLSF